MCVSLCVCVFGGWVVANRSACVVSSTFLGIWIS